MNRKNQIKQNINGGTTAPPKTAKGPNYAVSPAHSFNKGIGQAAPLPAPKPAPPGPPQPNPQTPLPWEVNASNDEAAALRKEQNTITGLGDNWVRQEQNYGLEGPWADFKTNPYSQAALLQSKYDSAQRGTMNSYAAGGHLYSGALGRARGGNERAFDQSRSDLVNRRGEAFAKKEAEKTGAEDAFREAQNEANWNRINAGLKEEPDATAVPKAGKKSKAKDRAKKNISRGKAAK